jgi:hypothetical protein
MLASSRRGQVARERAASTLTEEIIMGREKWLRRGAILALAVLVFGKGEPAPALVPPRSLEWLLAKSDVVADVRVLEVTCLEVSESRPPEWGRLRTFQARLEVLRVKKGRVKPGDTLLVQWEEWEELSNKPHVIGGRWVVEYYPGEEAATHLYWRKDLKAFRTTWWNAKSELKPAKSYQLPRNPGDRIGVRNGKVYTVLSPGADHFPMFLGLGLGSAVLAMGLCLGTYFWVRRRAAA